MITIKDPAKVRIEVTNPISHLIPKNKERREMIDMCFLIRIGPKSVM